MDNTEDLGYGKKNIDAEQGLQSSVDTTERYEDEEESQEDDPPQVEFDAAAKITEAFNSDGTVRKIIKARKSTFVHNLVHLNGSKFDFTGRDYLRPIYDGKDKQILLKTSRQVEKC